MKNKKILIGIVILLVAVIGGVSVYSMTRPKTIEEQLNGFEFSIKPPSEEELEALKRYIGDIPEYNKGKNHSDQIGYPNSGW